MSAHNPLRESATSVTGFRQTKNIKTMKHNSYHKRGVVFKPIERKPRSVKECLIPTGEIMSNDFCTAYNRVTQKEAEDLYANRRTIIINIVDEVKTWWKPARMQYHMVKKEHPEENFFKALARLRKEFFPRWRHELYFFVEIPIHSKKKFASAV